LPTGTPVTANTGCPQDGNVHQFINGVWQ
jgi:hypothetical protein